MQSGHALRAIGGLLAVVSLAGLAWQLVGPDDAGEPGPGVAAPRSSVESVAAPPAELPVVAAPAVEPLTDASGAPTPGSGAGATPGGTAPSVLPTLASLAPRVVLTGRILDDRGEPVPDAEVVHVPSSALIKQLGRKSIPFGPDLPWDDFERARSDADGRFRLPTHELPRSDPAVVTHASHQPAYPSGALTEPSLAVLHPDFEARLYACEAYVEGDFDVGDITLAPGPSLSGRLVDEQAAPVVGARVGLSLTSMSPRSEEHLDRAWSVLSEVLAVESGDDGRFRLGSLWSGALELRVEHPRYVPLDRQVEVPAGGHDLGDVVLESGGTIAGVVLDAAGQPVAGAKVKARASSLDMTRGATDTAAYEFTIIVRSDNMHEVETLTDEHGAFELFTLNQPAYRLIAGADGFEPALQTEIAVGRRDVRLELAREAWGLVTVRDARTQASLPTAVLNGRRYLAGQPQTPEYTYSKLTVLAGAEVAQALRAKLGDDVPDAEGLFLVRGLGQGRNLLLADAEGYATTAVELPAALPGARVDGEVLLAREALVAGRVVDGAGAPIADATIDVTGSVPSSTPGRARSVHSDAEGRFRITALAAGEWTFAPRAPGFVRGEPLRLTLAAEQHQEDVTLRLDAGGVIRGVVYDSRGQLAANRSVEVRRVSAAAGPQSIATATATSAAISAAIANPTATATGEQGRFAAVELPAGTYSVLAKPGDPVLVELPPGGEVEVELFLRQPPTITGRVTDGNGPVVGARVLLDFRRDAGSEWSDDADADTRTDQSGGYRLQPWAAGEFRVRATSGRARTAAVEVSAGWGEQSLVDLQFGTARISGRVLESGTQRPIAKAHVNLMLFDGAAATAGAGRSGMEGEGAWARTDADGRFEASQLRPGRYEVQASADGFQRATLLDVAIPGDDELQLELLPGAILELTARVTNGQPVPHDLQLAVQGKGAEGADLGTLMVPFEFSNSHRRWRGDLPPGPYRLQLLLAVRDASGATVSTRVLAERDVILSERAKVALEVPIAP